MTLVKKEMEWTVICFMNKANVWEELAKGSKKEGHSAYGWKQSSMWRTRANVAANVFRLLKGT